MFQIVTHKVSIGRSSQSSYMYFLKSKSILLKVIIVIIKYSYENMIDHRSYTHNLSSCELKASKKLRPEVVCISAMINQSCLHVFLRKSKHMIFHIFICKVQLPYGHLVNAVTNGTFLSQLNTQ